MKVVSGTKHIVSGVSRNKRKKKGSYKTILRKQGPQGNRKQHTHPPMPTTYTQTTVYRGLKQPEVSETSFPANILQDP